MNSGEPKICYDIKEKFEKRLLLKKTWETPIRVSSKETRWLLLLHFVTNLDIGKHYTPVFPMLAQGWCSPGICLCRYLIWGDSCAFSPESHPHKKMCTWSSGPSPRTFLGGFLPARNKTCDNDRMTGRYIRRWLDISISIWIQPSSLPSSSNEDFSGLQ